MNECVMLCHCNVVVRGACMLMRTRSARIVQKNEKNQEKPHNHRETTETDQHHSTTTATIMTITTHALPLFEVEIPVGNDPARRGAPKRRNASTSVIATICYPPSQRRVKKTKTKNKHTQTKHIYTYIHIPRNLENLL